MIWKGRNKFTFQQEPLNPILIINPASGLVKEFFDKVQSPRSSVLESSKFLKCWRPPPHNRLKCNVDAAFHADSNVGAIAAIIRDSSGTMITASARKIHCPSSLVAESLAVREGLQLAHNCLCESIVLESDNLQIIEACRSKKMIGEIATILNDIRVLSDCFHLCAFTWTPREGNQVAHLVAQLSIAGTLRGDWITSKPDSLAQLLLADARSRI